LSTKTNTDISKWKLDDEKFLKVGELCDSNTTFNLLLKNLQPRNIMSNLTPYILMLDSPFTYDMSILTIVK